MKELEFTFAGIQFKVDVDATMEDTFGDSVIESIEGVYIWDNEEREYKPISCNYEAFEKDLQDQINEAFEEMYNDQKAYYEDMAFEAAREERFEKMCEQGLVKELK